MFKMHSDAGRMHTTVGLFVTHAMSFDAKMKMAFVAIVLVALLAVPAPLLPPHRLTEALRTIFGIGWTPAYLVAAVAVQVVFYGLLGVLAASTVNRAGTLQGRLFQVVTIPVLVVGVAIIIRSLKMGHLPIWINAAVPTAACVIGVLFGLGLLYGRWKGTIVVVVLLLGMTLWEISGGGSTELRHATEAHLQNILSVAPSLPTGEARFESLLRIAFAPVPHDGDEGDAVEQNQAAIVAWGIVVGHERLARLVGLNPDSQLVRRAAEVREGVTLRGREDWARHYALSAALAVLEHPLISDAGGLMKEQLDALTRGTGFSFGDLAADRAGVRFATAATSSEASAKAMQLRIRRAYSVDDLFPATIDFPENLSVEEFRRDFGGVGSQRYRSEVNRIEAQLDSCAALSPLAQH